MARTHYFPTPDSLPAQIDGKQAPLPAVPSPVASTRGFHGGPPMVKNLATRPVLVSVPTMAPTPPRVQSLAPISLHKQYRASRKTYSRARVARIVGISRNNVEAYVGPPAYMIKRRDAEGRLTATAHGARWTGPQIADYLEVCHVEEAAA